jgi:3,4-dihydroxy-2-butanone 4-phosphate synthase
MCCCYLSPCTDREALSGWTQFVVVVDDEDRENEGDLIMPADMMTPEAMAFLVQHSTGIVCVGMKGEMLDRLQIPLMVPDKDNEEALLTAFTVTVVNNLLSSCSICYGCHHLKGSLLHCHFFQL